MPDDINKQISPEGWLMGYTSHLLKKLNSLYANLIRWHSMGGGNPDQVVQRRDSVSRSDEGDPVHSISLLVSPLGIDISYERRPGDSRPWLGAEITRVDERVVIRGDGFGEAELKSSYTLHDDGGKTSDTDEELLEGMPVLSPSDISVLLLKYYASAALGQTRAALKSKGVAPLPVEIVFGVEGVRRKLNLASIDRFNNPQGVPYTADGFEKIILPALIECYAGVSHHRYDRLFILDSSILVDCGDHSLLEKIVKNGSSDADERIARSRSAYHEHSKQMHVYEHDNAVIWIVEKLFPESGSVYLHTMRDGFVERLFNCYVLPAKSMSRTTVHPSHLSMDDRGLNIYFTGELAEAEFLRLSQEYHDQREMLEKERNILQVLDLFDT
ncbi:hypothetical protein KY359_01410 [Candidatus Woesearchaeota archaeon]|nr:hypothetical protein [Candidatus Woesearchaeota archaeon]